MSLGHGLSLTLAQVHSECGAIRGTVLANAEGLILAACGELDSETAAAASVHIAQVIEQHLALLQPSGLQEQIIWTEDAVWYILRLSQGYVLMATADVHCAAGMLRLVCRPIDAVVRGLLAQARQEVQSLSIPESQC